jgi:coatomer protein complex subunit epsilon
MGQYHIILSEVKESGFVPVGLRAVRVMATFLSDPSKKDAALAQVQEWLGDFSTTPSSTLKLITAMLHMHDDNLKEALKVIRNPTDMEQHGLTTQIYLRMDRLDLAQKQLKSMRSIDEDSTLTQLATAWVHLATPGKAQDASYIYEELSDKHGASALLLNGLAVSKMHQAAFEEAETLLQEAIGKSPSDPDSLANLVAVSQHLQRAPEVIARYLAQLKAKAPGHQLIAALATFEGAYDRVAAGLLP